MKVNIYVENAFKLYYLIEFSMELCIFTYLLIDTHTHARVHTYTHAHAP